LNLITGAWIDQLRLNWRLPTAAQARRWPSGTQLLPLSRAIVRVRDIGAGPRIVILTPDAPLVLESYDALIELLSHHVRVVCCEFPGVGFSYPRLGFNFTLADHLAIVREIMDRLDIGHATLAFTCINALHAIAFADAHPSRVDRLVLAQVANAKEMRSYAKRIAFRFAGLNVLAAPVLGQLLLAMKRDLVARSWFRAAAPDLDCAERLWQTSRAVFAEGGQFCLASIVQSGLLDDVERLIVASCPADVTWGDADRTHRKTCKTSIRTHLPQATLEHCAGCGHFPDIEAPVAYGRLILQGREGRKHVDVVGGTA
jgi:pimeloyl-ACP methyl ester carboxylesterase